jgi:hypothetical protein
MRIIVIPVFVLALICCTARPIRASVGDQSNSSGEPFKVDGQCPNGSPCKSIPPASPPSTRPLSGISPASDPLPPPIKQQPALPAQPAPPVSPRVSWPWDQVTNSNGASKPTAPPMGHGGVAPPSGPDAGGRHDGIPLSLNHGDSPTPESGLSALNAVLFNVAGTFVGLAASLVVLKYSLAKRFESRPFGDRVRKTFLAGQDNSTSWVPENLHIETFQFETAVRDELITPTEYRNLRSKYLVSGNFGFSMLIPVVLGNVYLTIGMGFWMALATSSVVAGLTTVLIVYAVDRRHEFRSQYRTLIIQNLKRRPTENIDHVEPKVQNLRFSTDDIVRALEVLIRLSSTWRPQSPGTSTERPPEESGT